MINFIHLMVMWKLMKKQGKAIPKWLIKCVSTIFSPAYSARSWKKRLLKKRSNLNLRHLVFSSENSNFIGNEQHFNSY